MRLICFNVCIKIDNNKEIANFLISKNPDIVCFQEILNNIDSKVFDMYKSKKFLDKKLKSSLPYSFFGPSFICDAIRINSKKHRDFNGFVEQGNQISSKFEIISAKSEFFHRCYELKQNWNDFKINDHGRNLVSAILDINGKSLMVLNLHGVHSKDKLDSSRTLNQCEFVLNAAKESNIPVIIAGDFNLLKNTKSIGLLSNNFRNLIEEFDVHSTRPDFDDGLDVGDNVVDYIFVNSKIKVNNFEVVKTDISDHHPLVLDFDILD